MFGNEVAQSQDSVESFCQKIKAGRDARISSDFMVVARIESLILDAGMTDALNRAAAYVQAGADAIMIHSRKKDGQEIFEFAKLFRQQFEYVPLICVPTS